jgi:hypothetical protein
MRSTPTARTALVMFAACCTILSGCGDSAAPGKTETAVAKRARDAALLALDYPQSSGAIPRTMVSVYDGANDSTIITLELAGLRPGGSGGANVGSIVLHLTSIHKGPVRPVNDLEGSIDGRLVLRAATAGHLAYSGPPGVLVAGGGSTPLKAPSGKGGYSSTRISGGVEESVRFRIPTEDLVNAASAGSMMLSIGTVQVELSAQHLADLREFAARLKPGT